MSTGAWSNDLQTSLTLPTGATSGPRIVLDGSTSVIRMYDSAGLLCFELNSNTGDLTMLNNLFQTFIQLTGGSVGTADGFYTGPLITPGVLPTATEVNNSANIVIVNASLDIESPAHVGVAPNTSHLVLLPGLNGSTTGGFTPSVSLTPGDLASDVDVLVPGSIVKSDRNNSYLAYQWQAAASIYRANWFDGGVFAGLGGDQLLYRLDAEDNLVIQGLSTTTGPGTFIMDLPPAYRPQNGFTPHFQVNRNRGGVLSMHDVAIVGATGEVIIDSNPAAGDEYSFNATIPLFHIA